MIIVSFCICLLGFVLVGFLSVLKHTQTTTDYLLADHSVKPWLVALSAVATNNSGYMFVGMIGYTYTTGLSSIWLMIGWIVGDFIASIFIHRKLRVMTVRNKALSFAGVLSQWHEGSDFKCLRAVAGLITVLFLGTYAAAQLSAGSKALHVLFGWHYSVGAIIGAAIVFFYCVAGGIRASIWTDVAQSFVMIIAMSLLCFVSIDKMGGITAFHQQLTQISTDYMAFFNPQLKNQLTIAPYLFVLGWLFAGFGVIGQPHIMIRFMVMENPRQMNKVRIIYYTWYSVFAALTITVGLAARLILPEAHLFDAELALPTLAKSLLPDYLVGLVLAALFAATMSTADSQILSCSAALTRDFHQHKKISYLQTKLTTVIVTLVALGISLWGDKSVFNLVLIAWSALAAAFAPLLTVYALGGKPSETTALTMITSGILTIIIWRYLQFNHLIYEVAPGILVGFLPYFLSRAK